MAHVKKVNNTFLLKQNIVLYQNVRHQTVKIKIKFDTTMFVLLFQNVVITRVSSFHQKNILSRHVKMDLEKEVILLEVQNHVHLEKRRIPRENVEKQSKRKNQRIKEALGLQELSEKNVVDNCVTHFYIYHYHFPNKFILS